MLIEEVGEVAAELKKTWSDNYPALVPDDLRDELADVFVLVSALASSFDLDLQEAIDAKFFGADAEREWATAAEGMARSTELRHGLSRTAPWRLAVDDT